MRAWHLICVVLSACNATHVKSHNAAVVTREPTKTPTQFEKRVHMPDVLARPRYDTVSIKKRTKRNQIPTNQIPTNSQQSVPKKENQLVCGNTELTMKELRWFQRTKSNYGGHEALHFIKALTTGLSPNVLEQLKRCPVSIGDICPPVGVCLIVNAEAPTGQMVWNHQAEQKKHGNSWGVTMPDSAMCF
jgi:hypothetical protein